MIRGLESHKLEQGKAVGTTGHLSGRIVFGRFLDISKFSLIFKDLKDALDLICFCLLVFQPLAVFFCHRGGTQDMLLSLSFLRVRSFPHSFPTTGLSLNINAVIT